MESPSTKEIEKFINIFDKLCQFEATQRVVKGGGCLDTPDLSFKEVIKVIGWLRQKAYTKEADIIDYLIKKYENLSETLRVQSAQAQCQNDYIMYSTLQEEAEIYEKIVQDIKEVVVTVKVIK